MRRHGPQATTGFQQGDANVPSEAYSPGDPGLWPARVFSQRRQQIQQREQRNLNGEQSLFPPRLLFTRPCTLYRSDAFTGASLACLPGMEPFKGLEGLAGSDLTAETSDSIQKPPSQVQLLRRVELSAFLSAVARPLRNSQLRPAPHEVPVASTAQGQGLAPPMCRSTVQRLWAGRRWDQDSLGGVKAPLA